MKKIVAGALACCMLAGVVPASLVKFADSSLSAEAADEYIEGESGFLTYKKYEDHVVISDCKTTAMAAPIPAEIEGLPVTEIGDNAFQDCSVLK